MVKKQGRGAGGLEVVEIDCKKVRGKTIRKLCAGCSSGFLIRKYGIRGFVIHVKICENGLQILRFATLCLIRHSGIRLRCVSKKALCAPRSR